MTDAIDRAIAQREAEEFNEANRTLGSIFEEQRLLQTQADLLQADPRVEGGPSGVSRGDPAQLEISTADRCQQPSSTHVI